MDAAPLSPRVATGSRPQAPSLMSVIVECLTGRRPRGAPQRFLVSVETLQGLQGTRGQQREGAKRALLQTQGVKKAPIEAWEGPAACASRRGLTFLSPLSVSASMLQGAQFSLFRIEGHRCNSHSVQVPLPAFTHQTYCVPDPGAADCVQDLAGLSGPEHREGL